MNLPLITAKIGRDFKSGDIFESMYKMAKTNDKKKYSDVFLTVDLVNGVIELDEPIGHQREHSKKFNYFGNNSARASQTHLVREAGSLRYLLFKVWNDLYKNIKNEDYDELESSFELLIKEEFLSINEGHCEINLLKFKFPIDDVEKILEDNQKVILLNSSQKEIYNESPSKFIKDCLNITSKEEISLIIPRIKTEDGKEIILSQHLDYLKLIKRVNKLGSKTNSSQKTQMKKLSTCYICGESKSDVSAEYSKSLDPSGINKIFITTNTNYSYDFEKNNQIKSYSLCNDCYKDLKNGEKILKEKYEMRLAGERTFVLAEGYLNDFDYNYLPELKKQIDAVFHPKDFENFSTHVEEEAETIEQNSYAINFVIYRTDGKSVTILQTIEDINNKNFSKIIKRFKKNNGKLERLTENYSLKFGLHSIYRLIPVKTSKDRTQQNIKRVLSLYSAIFKLEKIKTKVLFEYAREALEKGISQLRSSEIRNYQNLGLSQKEGIDYFIKRITMSYIALIQSLQDLHITDKKVFNNHTERGGIMAENGKLYLTDETEIFLKENGFSKEAKSLFYLGCLLGKVGSTQYMKNHKSKPILNKIIFQGMNKKDILRLYNELVEKLRQYKIVNYSNELLMQKFHENFGAAEKDRQLSDHENVFYLMSGYSFLVGKKSTKDDQTDKESEEKENENE
jgi:CRISPR-associated protein Csh1